MEHKKERRKDIEIKGKKKRVPRKNKLKHELKDYSKLFPMIVLTNKIFIFI